MGAARIFRNVLTTPRQINVAGDDRGSERIEMKKPVIADADVIKIGTVG